MRLLRPLIAEGGTIRQAVVAGGVEGGGGWIRDEADVVSPPSSARWAPGWSPGIPVAILRGAAELAPQTGSCSSPSWAATHFVGANSRLGADPRRRENWTLVRRWERRAAALGAARRGSPGVGTHLDRHRMSSCRGASSTADAPQKNRRGGGRLRGRGIAAGLARVDACCGIAHVFLTRRVGGCRCSLGDDQCFTVH